MLFLDNLVYINTHTCTYIYTLEHYTYVVNSKEKKKKKNLTKSMKGTNNSS